MRRSILVPVLTVLATAVLFSGCAGKYADAKRVNADHIKLTEAYIADLDQADNAESVAKAMNRYADGLEKIWPRMQALSEKHPELKDTANPPEELKESHAAATEVGKKMAATFMKIMPHMSDPEVQKAQQRIASVVSTP